jgi:hypothetical protein
VQKELFETGLSSQNRSHDNGLARTLKDCFACGKQFIARDFRASFCSEKCQKFADHIYELDHRQKAKCQRCGKEFIPSNNSKGMFCSCHCKALVCGGRHGWNKRDSRVIAIDKLCKLLARIKDCVVCGKRQIRQSNSLASTCSRECDLEYGRRKSKEKLRRYRPLLLTSKICASCNKEFSITYVHSHLKQIYCPVCVKRRNKRNGSQEQRARRAGVVYQYVIKEKVFERDGWRCHLCGRKTPMKLMGTYDNRAPELDHIIPLGCKGSHVYENVKCCCRECNGNKGAIPLGQPMLFGMIPTVSVAYKRHMGHR